MSLQGEFEMYMGYDNIVNLKMISFKIYWLVS
jgi:hypothetical protein